MPMAVCSSPVMAPAIIPAMKAHSSATQTLTPLVISMIHTAPPVQYGSIHRQVGQIQDLKGDINADGHEPPNQALGQGARQRIEQI